MFGEERKEGRRIAGERNRTEDGETLSCLYVDGKKPEENDKLIRIEEERLKVGVREFRWERNRVKEVGGALEESRQKEVSASYLEEEGKGLRKAEGR